MFERALVAHSALEKRTRTRDDAGAAQVLERLQRYEVGIALILERVGWIDVELGTVVGYVDPKQGLVTRTCRRLSTHTL